MIKNQSVLITGGTGSLGKYFIDFILNNKRYCPRQIRILSRDEDKQYWLRNFYKSTKHYAKLDFVIGDIRNYSSVVSALQNIDIVIHAAAMKQVPVCENSPYEAVETNVIGSDNIAKAIEQYKIPVKKVIGISTDKACDPINVYGMTKSIQERIFTLANLKIKYTNFSIVRYGNVLGSRGSVVPLFTEQIKNGGPVTITNEEMTRFFFSLEDAASTILASISQSKKGEIFIPKIKSFKIINLAKAMIGNSNIAIETIGIRQGEKKHEILISSDELPRVYSKVVENKAYYVIKPFYEKPINKIFIKSYASNDNTNDLKETYILLKKNKII